MWHFSSKFNQVLGSYFELKKKHDLKVIATCYCFICLFYFSEINRSNDTGGTHTHTSEWNYEISHQLLVQVPLFSTEQSKGKILALSQELR